MSTLIIDSSHKYLAVGLVKNDEIIYKKQDILKQKQSEYLITYIQDVLKNGHMNKEDITEIVLTDGPGSYTGMRIAMTFAKVFVLTQDIKINTINTLRSVAGKNDGFVFLDARSKRVFGAFIENGTLIEERIYTLDELEVMNANFIGDVELLDKKEQNIDVIQNILDLKTFWKEVENPDLLSPRYA